MREKGTYVDLPYGLYLELEAEANERDTSKKAIHIEALEAYLGVSSGESESVIRRKLKREKREMRDLKEEVQDFQRRLHDKQNRVEEYEHMLEERANSKDAYAESLEQLVAEIEDGTTPHVWETSSPVVELADEHSKSPGEVMYDLKQKAKETDSNVTNANFVRKPKADDMRANNNVVAITEMEL